MKLPTAGHSYRFLVMFGGVTIHGLALGLPIFMMQLYDRILPNTGLATLTWLAAAAVTALVLEAALRTARQRWASWAGERALYRARRQLIDRILAEGPPAQDARKAFEGLRTILMDSYQQKSFFLSDLPFGLLYLGLIYLIHPYLCVVLVSLGTAVYLFYRAIRPAYAETVQDRETLLERREAWMQATFGSLAELKALGAEEQVSRHHRRLLEELHAVEGNLTDIETNKLAVTKLIESLSVFGPLILGGAFVIQGKLSLGALTACVLLARRALGPLVGWAERSYAEVELRQARRHLFRAVRPGDPASPREVPKGEPLPEGPQPLILEGVILRQGFLRPRHAQSLALGLAGALEEDDRAVLRLRDARFEPGDAVWFASDPPLPYEGLFHALRGNNRNYSGQLVFGGTDLAQVGPADRARTVGLVEEHNVLLPGTFLENLSLFEPTLRDRAQSLASKLGLDPVFEGLDRGYETLVTDRLAAGLAPGVVQRVALARSLVSAPRILILDGFDRALDPESRDRCVQVLREFRNRTVLFYRGPNTAMRDECGWEAVLVGGAAVFRRRKP